MRYNCVKQLLIYYTIFKNILQYLSSLSDKKSGKKSISIHY